MKVVITGHKLDKELTDFARSPYYNVYYSVEYESNKTECVLKVWKDKFEKFHPMIADLFTIKLHENVRDKIEEAIVNYCKNNNL